MASSQTGILYLPGEEEHVILDPDPEYNEKPRRVVLSYERLVQTGLIDYMKASPVDGPRECTNEEMGRCHHKAYTEKMESTSEMSKDELILLSKQFECVSFCETSFQYAKKVAGSVIDLCDEICKGQLRNALALVRPPSHHAEFEMGASGYCLLNTGAMAVENMLQKVDKVKRVLILDWDVHHGQGTQRLFYDRKDVLYISLHSHEDEAFYPYLAESDHKHCGQGDGVGYNINIAWNQKHLGDAEYMAAFLQIVLPVAYWFNPDFILVSAGFDSTEGDFEGRMKVTPGCFAHMTHHLSALADGKLLVLLEGGYNPEAVADCVEAVAKVLIGMPPPFLKIDQEINPGAVTTILDVISVMSNYWTCFQFQEDKEGDAHCNTNPCKEEFQVKEDQPSEKILAEPVGKYDCEIKYETYEDCKIGYCFDCKMLLHKNEGDPYHPEKPERIASINTHLTTRKLLKTCQIISDEFCNVEELRMIHSRDYIQSQQSLHSDLTDEKELAHALVYSMGSVFHNKHTYGCALVSAGCLLKLTRLAVEDSSELRSGFANIRPPGHHAEVSKEFGFCFFNNVAVVAQVVLKQYPETVKRILILDWDVHHGNATQRQFENNPNVLYISLHNASIFPGGLEKWSDRVGSGHGVGFNINIAWDTGGARDLEYLLAFTNVILPVLYEYSPDLVLVSAGFDSAVGDPLGGQDVSPECFAHMTHMLMAFAAGRVVLALEGGYNLHTISLCAENCVKTLQKKPCKRIPLTLKRAVIKPYHRNGIINALWHHRKYWKQLRFLKSVEPCEPIDANADQNDVGENGEISLTSKGEVDLSEVPPVDTKASMIYWRKYWQQYCQSHS